MKYFFYAVLLLNVLVWGSYFAYNLTDTCFMPFAGEKCTRAPWGFAFFLGVQVPLAMVVGALFVAGANEVKEKWGL